MSALDFIPILQQIAFHTSSYARRLVLRTGNIYWTTRTPNTSLSKPYPIAGCVGAPYWSAKVITCLGQCSSSTCGRVCNVVSSCHVGSCTCMSFLLAVAFRHARESPPLSESDQPGPSRVTCDSESADLFSFMGASCVYF